MIQVQNLSKIFKVHKKEPGFAGSVRALFKREYTEKHAVKNVSFAVSPGEIVGLIGANGAGKTTIVKSLTGIIHPTSGNINILGHVPSQRKTDFQKQIYPK